MTNYKGSCHCGAITVELETKTDPAEIEIRECQCSFCRAHGAVSASDPNGRIRYIDREPGDIVRYTAPDEEMIMDQERSTARQEQ